MLFQDEDILLELLDLGVYFLDLGLVGVIGDFEFFLFGDVVLVKFEEGFDFVREGEDLGFYTLGFGVFVDEFVAAVFIFF